MRTSEERVQELHQRMDSLKQKRSLRRYRIQCAVLCAACLAIVVAMAFAIAGTEVQPPVLQPGGSSASIFADQAALGYVVIAVLAFFLGVFFTIFCFRIRKHREEQEHDRKS